MDWRTDKENRIAVIPLHECGLERARIYLLKPLSITLDLVYRTVTLFLDTGGLNDRKISGRSRVVRAPQLIFAVCQELPEILSENHKIVAREILFVDGIIFTAEETFNKQNDRIYAWSSKEARKVARRIERGSVMV
jgi:hypothetical protein